MENLEQKLKGLVNYYPAKVDLFDSNSILRAGQELYGKHYIKVEVTQKIKPVGIRCLKLKTNKGYRLFVAKDSWEGAIKEGIGQEIYNLITKKQIKYLCNEEIFISDFFQPRYDPSTTNRLLDTKEYLFKKGELDEIADFLALEDRFATNIILTRNKELIHIDFGSLFSIGYEMDSFLNIKQEIRRRELKSYWLGRIEASKRIYKNLIKNHKKIKYLTKLFNPSFIKEINKARRGMIHPSRHIYKYAIDRGWISPNEDLFKKLKHEAKTAAK